MLKAKLGNEFGNPSSKEYQVREAAFDAYNFLIERVPETVTSVMSRLALNEAIAKGNRLESTVQRVTLNVLDATNHGTQIGIAPPAREAAWAQVFEDEGHQTAAQEYRALQNEEKNSPEAIAACRKRGLETLKVVAQTHIDAIARQEETSPHISSPSMAA